MTTTSALKNINLLSKEQYDAVISPAEDELFAVSGSGVGLPSSRYEDLELGASETSYKAPGNGYVQVIQTNSATGYCNLYSNVQSMVYAANGQSVKVNIPVKKGGIFIYAYSGRDASSANNRFRFYYSEGE